MLAYPTEAVVVMCLDAWCLEKSVVYRLQYFQRQNVSFGDLVRNSLKSDPYYEISHHFRKIVNSETGCKSPSQLDSSLKLLLKQRTDLVEYPGRFYYTDISDQCLYPEYLGIPHFNLNL